MGILEKIIREEEGHVGFGVKWYRVLCGEMGLEVGDRYGEFMKEFGVRVDERAWNSEARGNAGFDVKWIGSGSG